MNFVRRKPWINQLEGFHRSHPPMTLLRELDFNLLIPAMILYIFGVYAVFLAGFSPQFSSPFFLVKSKIFYLFWGILIALGLSQIDYHLYENKKYQIIGAVLIVLFLVLVICFGKEDFGARLRFQDPIFGKTIQPTEYIKVLIVIVLSYTISETFHKDLFSYMILSVHSLLLATLFLLIALQPDYGAILLMSATAISMLICARIQVIKIILIFAILFVITVTSFILLSRAFSDHFYLLDRFKIFLDCFLVSGCRQYQMKNAYNAIISGNLFGQSIRGSLHISGILPMDINDFVFCVIAEEMGFIGITLLITLYIFLIKRGIWIAKNSIDFFGQLLAFGLTASIGFQTLLNLLVATGLVPITGLTLPFISHGSNSLISTMISLGLLLNISKQTLRIRF